MEQAEPWVNQIAAEGSKYTEVSVYARILKN